MPRTIWNELRQLFAEEPGVSVRRGRYSDYYDKGVVISSLWNWFISPLGVPNLSIVGATGIFILVRLFNIHDYDQAMKDMFESIPSERLPDSVVSLYFLSLKQMAKKPIFALVSGAIVHLLQ